MKKLIPNDYVTNVLDITVEYLKQRNLQGLILDVDNTLMDLNKNKVEGLKKWHDELTKNGIKSIILSNTIDRKKVREIAKYLEIDYIFFANKPSVIGFKYAANKMGINRENIAVIGDQIFTDVWGANKAKMYSILVKPICETNDYIITKIKRPLERYILKKYMESKGEDND